MNYLVAADRFEEDAPGGAWHIAWQLAQLMRRRGHRVAMLCGSTDRDPPSGPCEVKGITVVRYRFPNLSAWNPGRFRIHVRSAEVAARSHLGNVSWDVVHAHTPAAGWGAWRAVAGQRSRRLIYTVHSPVKAEQRINWSGPGLLPALKRTFGLPLVGSAELGLLNAAERVHVLSQFTDGELFREYGARLRRPVVAVPWWATDRGPVETHAARAALGWGHSDFVFFSLRRLVPRMGLDLLLEAFARLDNERARAVIGGDGPERPALERKARALGVDTRVRFLGRISDEDARKAYAACDVFVLPTRALECFGLIALEAMSFGRPVLASEVGAIPEVVGAVLPGWLFPPGDVGRLASLMRAASSGALERPSAAVLRHHAMEAYDPVRLEAAYARLLEEAP